MTVNKKSLENLNRKGRLVPDDPKDNKRTTIRFDEKDLEWLKTLPHGISFNVREAVKFYRSIYDRRKELV